MGWGRVDVQQRRVEFVVLAARRERSFAALCAEFEISRQTGYEWLRRYSQGGLAAVVERSRQPRHSPRRTAEAVEQRVVELRQQRPDWGAAKLAVLLAREGVELKPLTLHRILLRHGLVRSAASHRPALQRFERAAPNELWQMDFKGLPPHLAQHCLPLSLLDDHSRFAPALVALTSTRAEPVRDALVEAFSRYGQPVAMLMDHGTPWWNTQSAGGWTWLSVWLIKHGIRVYFSGVRHPQTQGKVERFHRSLDEALWRRGWPAQSAQWQSWLDEFRTEYNEVRPHAALAMDTPAHHYQPSPRRYQAHPPDWLYAPGADLQRLSSTGQLSLPGSRWEISNALADEWVQLHHLPGRVLVAFRNTIVREIDLTSGLTFTPALSTRDLNSMCQPCPDSPLSGMS